ncbi:MAG: pro-sigmaK processing inhibitor BofA family protein [Bacilli bacterium]|nr:pro-sigmaK processing inhibitor BofA family protein [Bacilli bacterium]
MKKVIIKVIRSIIVAAFILYGFNIIAAPLNLIIPINVVTVALVALLGFPALIGLIMFVIIVF